MKVSDIDLNILNNLDKNYEKTYLKWLIPIYSCSIPGLHSLVGKKDEYVSVCGFTVTQCVCAMWASSVSRGN